MDVVQKVSLVESRILEDVIVLTVGAGTAPDPETIAVPTAEPVGDRRSASAGNVLILARATTRAVDAIRNIDGVPGGTVSWITTSSKGISVAYCSQNIELL